MEFMIAEYCCSEDPRGLEAKDEKKAQLWTVRAVG